jgi:excisionase family DNA binding protein
MSDGRQAFRVSSLAERWDCSPGKIRDLIKRGDIPCLRLGTMIRIPAAAVYSYEAESLARKPVPTTATAPASNSSTTMSLRVERALMRMNRPENGGGGVVRLKNT